MKEDRRIYNESLWKKDLKMIWKLEKWDSNFRDGLHWEIGNQKSMKFRKDWWAGNESLKFNFPWLF